MYRLIPQRFYFPTPQRVKNYAIDDPYMLAKFPKPVGQAYVSSSSGIGLPMRCNPDFKQVNIDDFGNEEFLTIDYAGTERYKLQTSKSLKPFNAFSRHAHSQAIKDRGGVKVTLNNSIPGCDISATLPVYENLDLESTVIQFTVKLDKKANIDFSWANNIMKELNISEQVRENVKKKLLDNDSDKALIFLKVANDENGTFQRVAKKHNIIKNKIADFESNPEGLEKPLIGNFFPETKTTYNITARERNRERKSLLYKELQLNIPKVILFKQNEQGQHIRSEPSEQRNNLAHGVKNNVLDNHDKILNKKKKKKKKYKSPDIKHEDPIIENSSNENSESSHKSLKKVVRFQQDEPAEFVKEKNSKCKDMKTQDIAVGGKTILKTDGLSSVTNNKVVRFDLDKTDVDKCDQETKSMYYAGTENEQLATQVTQDCKVDAGDAGIQPPDGEAIKLRKKKGKKKNKCIELPDNGIVEKIKEKEEIKIPNEVQSVAQSNDNDAKNNNQMLVNENGYENNKKPKKKLKEKETQQFVDQSNDNDDNSNIKKLVRFECQNGVRKNRNIKKEKGEKVRNEPKSLVKSNGYNENDFIEKVVRFECNTESADISNDNSTSFHSEETSNDADVSNDNIVNEVEFCHISAEKKEINAREKFQEVSVFSHKEELEPKVMQVKSSSSLDTLNSGNNFFVAITKEKSRDLIAFRTKISDKLSLSDSDDSDDEGSAKDVKNCRSKTREMKKAQRKKIKSKKVNNKKPQKSIVNRFFNTVRNVGSRIRKAFKRKNKKKPVTAIQFFEIKKKNSAPVKSDNIQRAKSLDDIRENSFKSVKNNTHNNAKGSSSAPDILGYLYTQKTDSSKKIQCNFLSSWIRSKLSFLPKIKKNPKEKDSHKLEKEWKKLDIKTEKKYNKNLKKLHP